jgi:hypothetical protein
MSTADGDETNQEAPAKGEPKQAKPKQHKLLVLAAWAASLLVIGIGGAITQNITDLLGPSVRSAGDFLDWFIFGRASIPPWLYLLLGLSAVVAFVVVVIVAAKAWVKRTTVVPTDPESDLPDDPYKDYLDDVLTLGSVEVWAHWTWNGKKPVTSWLYCAKHGAPIWDAEDQVVPPEAPGYCFRCGRMIIPDMEHDDDGVIAAVKIKVTTAVKDASWRDSAARVLRALFLITSDRTKQQAAEVTRDFYEVRKERDREQEV